MSPLSSNSKKMLEAFKNPNEPVVFTEPETFPLISKFPLPVILLLTVTCLKDGELPETINFFQFGIYLPYRGRLLLFEPTSPISEANNNLLCLR